jgi:hypothetical protein
MEAERLRQTCSPITRRASRRHRPAAFVREACGGDDVLQCEWSRSRWTVGPEFSERPAALQLRS